MFTKTSAIDKNLYFKSVSGPGPKSYQASSISLTKNSVSSVLSSEKPVFVSAKSGITLLVVSENPEGPYEKFILHGTIKIKPGIFYNLTSVSEISTIEKKLAPFSDEFETALSYEISWEPIAPVIQIAEIFTLYYQVKKAPYHFGPEQHHFCELTIVEQGQLETTVDGVTYQLGKNDAILYQKDQVHSQTVTTDETTTYITILFDMTLADPQFFDKIFHLNSGQISQVEAFIRVSEEESLPYKGDHLLARLKLFILSLVSESSPSPSKGTSMKEKYDQDLAQQITAYIKEHPEARVIDVTQAFGMSRSIIQSLFHRYIGMQPHAYIEEQRLKQAKILMRDSSYSLTEIALLVGYRSLPAFSRSFKHALGYSPSSYAKKLYKQI
ncbi:AraC family transcriptional regulator [Streptococcus merionis]|uniref:AraC family transcriptional regulator n=1 Tax=Streptococcus merionis TaxID=400065 RepID=UPI0026EB1ABB|nr:AraC family transcriptional regulator [Streptococcus merionis]